MLSKGFNLLFIFPVVGNKTDGCRYFKRTSSSYTLLELCEQKLLKNTVTQGMEKLSAAINELCNKTNKTSCLPKISTTRKHAYSLSLQHNKNSSAVHESSFDDFFLGARRRAEQKVSLPAVTSSHSKADTKRNIERNEDRWQERAARRPREGSEVVIVQMFAENSVAKNDEVFEEVPVSSHMSLSVKHLCLPARRNTKTEKTISPTLHLPGTANVQNVQNVETKAKQRNESSSGKGLTKMDLKIHTEREKQKTSYRYMQSDDAYSKKIVEDWLQKLP